MAAPEGWGCEVQLPHPPPKPSCDGRRTGDVMSCPRWGRPDTILQDSPNHHRQWSTSFPKKSLSPPQAKNGGDLPHKIQPRELFAKEPCGITRRIGFSACGSEREIAFLGTHADTETHTHTHTQTHRHAHTHTHTNTPKKTDKGQFQKLGRGDQQAISTQEFAQRTPGSPTSIPGHLVTHGTTNEKCTRPLLL